MDENLFLQINRHWISPGRDWVMAVASNLEFWYPLLVGAGLLVVWRGGWHGRLWLLASLLTLLVVEGVDAPLKHLFHRPRPPQVLVGVRQVDLDRHVHPRLLALGRPLDVRFSPPPGPAETAQPARSFPSGHVLNNFAVATMLTLFYRSWGWLYFLPAALVAYSRVYVGSHWPSDVGVSALLGAGLALCLGAVFEWAWARSGSRLLPAVWRQHPRLFHGWHHPPEPARPG